jgi:hypothetical protein
MSNGRIRSPRHLYFAVSIGLTLALAGMAGAVGAFDGRYTGSQTPMYTLNECGYGGFRDGITIVVKDNHFYRTWDRARLSLSVHVADDGTFEQSGSMYTYSHARPRMGSIRGKITGRNLEADLGDDRCMVHLSLKRV